VNTIKYIILLLFISGCATSAAINEVKSDETVSFFTALQNATQADLDAALVDAQAHNDVIAMACYPVLKTYAAKLGSAKQGDIKGAFSSFQKVRDVAQQQGATAIPDDLRLACSALVQETRDFIIKMTVIAAGASHGVPAIGGLAPAIGGALRSTFP
jgi:hypothetical protein